jgi:hypothetical protein
MSTIIQRAGSANEFKKKQTELFKKLKKEQKLRNKLSNNLLRYLNNNRNWRIEFVPKARITQANLITLKNIRNRHIEAIKTADWFHKIYDKEDFIRYELRSKSTNYIGHLIEMAEKELARKPRVPSPSVALPAVVPGGGTKPHLTVMGAPPRVRKTRSNKGVKRGPRPSVALPAVVPGGGAKPRLTVMGAPPRVRKTRSNKGVKRGPRKAKG